MKAMDIFSMKGLRIRNAKPKMMANRITFQQNIPMVTAQFRSDFFRTAVFFSGEGIVFSFRALISIYPFP